MMDLKVFLKHFLGEEEKKKKKGLLEANHRVIFDSPNEEVGAVSTKGTEISRNMSPKKKKKERNIPAVSVYVVVCERKAYVCARKKKNSK